jgi:two-component system osmolarity sensor histidine kinase EnvZ
MVVANLLDNACAYAPAGTTIGLGVAATAKGIQLTVVNATDGTLADAGAVFTPFWRGDTARSGDLHCGLGLALVQRLVLLMGGTVSADLDHERNFVITVVLPAAAPAG